MAQAATYAAPAPVAYHQQQLLPPQQRLVAARCSTSSSSQLQCSSPPVTPAVAQLQLYLQRLLRLQLSLYPSSTCCGTSGSCRSSCTPRTISSSWVAPAAPAAPVAPAAPAAPAAPVAPAAPAHLLPSSTCGSRGSCRSQPRACTLFLTVAAEPPIPTTPEAPDAQLLQQTHPTQNPEGPAAQ